MISEIKTSFAKKHPDIKLDYQSAGAGKLMAKIAAERESGKILADVLWTSEIPDFYQLKSQGLLLPFISTESKALLNPCPTTTDHSRRLTPGTLGIAYNTRHIKEPPKTWDDIKKPAFKGAFGIANPALSGTARSTSRFSPRLSAGDISRHCAATAPRWAKGSGQVVDNTASGDLVASLAVDYITLDKIDKGATLALVFPPEMLVIPSPIAIFKNSPNIEAAKNSSTSCCRRKARPSLPTRARCRSPSTSRSRNAESYPRSRTPSSAP